MHDGIVPDRHIIADDGLGLFECAVDHSTILDIDPVTYAYRIDIAPDDGAPPHGAIIAHDDITDDDCVVSEEDVFAKGWVEVVDGSDDGHKRKFLIQR